MQYVIIGGITLLILAAVPAFIAGGKGYSPFGYYLFGLLALPFAIMTALLLPRSGYEDDILGMRREIEDIRGILEDIKDNKN